MAPRTISLVAIISLYLVLIQRIAGLPDCTSHQIQQNDLSGCDCYGNDHKCDNKCPAGPFDPKCPQQESQVFLQDCGAHCATEKNHHCQSCWIWFQAVCSCVKNGGCLQSSLKAPFWAKITHGLISTSVLIPNILDLQSSQHALSISGWDFGQQKASDPKTQALVINSAHSITENQIHMHTCNTNAGMQQFLTDLYKGHPTTAFYKTLKDIPNPFAGEKMFCRASQTPHQPILGDSISNDINSVIKMSGVCPFYVGAAVIRDQNGYTWVCVTADHLSTEYHRFCAA